MPRYVCVCAQLYWEPENLHRPMASQQSQITTDAVAREDDDFADLALQESTGEALALTLVLRRREAASKDESRTSRARKGACVRGDRFRRKAPVADRCRGRLNWAYIVEKLGN
jgi:hypothetical protein